MLRDNGSIRCSVRAAAFFACGMLLAAPNSPVVAQKEPLRFVNLGLGGGGAMFSPSCSPHDQELMFVACDMGGVYRSQDGGQSWTMLDKRQLRNAKDYPVQFHPTDHNTCFAIGRGKLLVSRDRGRTFAPLLSQPPWQNERVDAVGVSPTVGSRLLVATADAIYASDDSGESWTRSEVAAGRIMRFVIAERTQRDECIYFAASANGVYRSDDEGRSWSGSSGGLPWRDLRSFCGGRDTATGHVALYCTIPSKRVNGKLSGGVYRSLDGGRAWQSAMSRGLNLDTARQDAYGIDDLAQFYTICATPTRPGTVYATTRGTGSQPPHHFTVFRSDDFGESWRYCFTPGTNVEPGWVPIELSWGFGGPALDFHVCPTNPEMAMYTNHAELYITRDGGASWHSAYSRRTSPSGRPARSESWTSRGLEVTTCWQVAFDPHDRQRAYICYTDIGFARSLDRGATWRYSGQGSPWRNTWYQVEFDPLQPGVLYGACANQHDIPNYMELDPARQLQPRRRGGGVCISRDFGATWEVLGKGLPPGAATSLALDLTSPKDKRTLYVAMFGRGIFKSVDSGDSWQHTSEGLGIGGNMHVYAVKLHADGTLFCTVTGKRDGTEFSEGSGLFRSTDGGRQWHCISPPLKWAGGFEFDPNDSRTLYLTASTAPRHPQGGLYKTTDGGITWQQVIKEGDLPRELHPFIHAFFVAVDPKNTGTVYFSSLTHGLFRSTDAGATWREIQGIPFTGVNRITLDPYEPDTIWVTTEGGGVWKGPASGYADR